MTDAGGFSEAILLRLVDRLVALEQQAATSMAVMKSITDHLAQLQAAITQLAHELNDLRTVSTADRQNFEQMRMPLQRLLDLRAKLSGVWLVVTALFVALAYLFQPLLAEFYRWRLGGS
jgi:hypothetical protein